MPRWMMRTRAAGLVALGIAGMSGPAMAQVLPEISIRHSDGITEDIAFAETIVQPCNSTSRGGLPVEMRASRGAQGVTVNTMAFLVSGHNRLFDVNVPVYISPTNEGPVVFRSRGAATYTGNSTNWFRLSQFSGGAGSPCFPDDRLITDDSVIEVVLMPGNGYTINPDMRSVLLTVEDDSEEQCANMAHITRMGGLLYKVRGGNLNDTCVCANQSRVVAAGIADGESESYATTALTWRTDSTNYCSDSPYRRPGR